MATDAYPLSLTRRINTIEAELRRHTAALTTGGFDPNADPVVIGASANGHAAVGAVSIGASSQTPGDNAVAVGSSAYGFGQDSVAVGDNAFADLNGVSVGGYTDSSGQFNTAVGYGSTALGPTDGRSTALGANSHSVHNYSTAVGCGASTFLDHQIVLGTSNEFVEIPGDSSTAPNGLVLTDTATGTRYLVQITSGALVLSTAP